MSEYVKKLKVGNFENEPDGYSIYYDSDYMPPSIIAVVKGNNKTSLIYAQELVRRWNAYEEQEALRKQRDDLLEFCKSIIKWQNNLPFQIVGIPTGLYDTGKKIIASAKKK